MGAAVAIAVLGSGEMGRTGPAKQISTGKMKYPALIGPVSEPNQVEILATGVDVTRPRFVLTFSQLGLSHEGTRQLSSFLRFRL